jgi:hypothetical protein
VTSRHFLPEQIEQWPVARLKPYSRNARTHSDDQIARIAGWLLAQVASPISGLTVANFRATPHPHWLCARKERYQQVVGDGEYSLFRPPAVSPSKPSRCATCDCVAPLPGCLCQSHARELGLTEEHIPDLIRMATDFDLHNLRQESPEVWAPLHAWRALAQLRAVEAAHPLVLLFEQLKHDDWLPEEFPTVFSMIGPGAIPTLERFLADDGIEEIGRISVPACLVRIAQDHPDDRDACVGVLIRQLEKLEINGPVLNGFLILSLIDLRETHAIGLIRQAFSENRVDLSVLGDVEDAEIEMGLRTSRSTPRPRLDLPGHLSTWTASPTTGSMINPSKSFQFGEP